MGEYLTVIFIVTLYLAELSGKVVILCLHTLERARQCRLIKFRAIDFRFDHFSEVAIFLSSSIISAQLAQLTAQFKVFISARK